MCQFFYDVIGNEMYIFCGFTNNRRAFVGMVRQKNNSARKNERLRAFDSYVDKKRTFYT